MNKNGSFLFLQKIKRSNQSSFNSLLKLNTLLFHWQTEYKSLESTLVTFHVTVYAMIKCLIFLFFQICTQCSYNEHLSDCTELPPLGGPPGGFFSDRRRGHDGGLFYQEGVSRCRNQYAVIAGVEEFQQPRVAMVSLAERSVRDEWSYSDAVWHG